MRPTETRRDRRGLRSRSRCHRSGVRLAADRPFRVGNRTIEIVGVALEGFTGTEPGAVTDFFLPSMMNAEALQRRGWTWFRIWIRPKPGVDHHRERRESPACTRDVAQG